MMMWHDQGFIKMLAVTGGRKNDSKRRVKHLDSYIGTKIFKIYFLLKVIPKIVHALYTNI